MKLLFFSLFHTYIVILLIVGSFFGIALVTALQANALTMTNSNYILQMGNVNTAAGKSTGSGFKLNQSVGQNAPGLSTGPSNKIRAGFQYISSIISFQFSISSQVIDFGILSATNPVTRTQTLTINNGSANGFTVTAAENHSLLRPNNGSMIPNTTCDTGTCSETTEGTWTSNLTYGFGFRCDNVSGTPCSFTTANSYRQFADLNNAKTPQAIMTGTNVGTNLQVQLTYKVNISATQGPGDYSNNIVFVATPTF